MWWKRSNPRAAEKAFLTNGCAIMEGIGIYTLDKSISDFQEHALVEFSEERYAHCLRTYGIGRSFPNEVFYDASDKTFLGYEATVGVVAALNGTVYKIYFNFLPASAEELNGFRKKAAEYILNRYGDSTEVRDLPNGMRIAIWDGQFGNLIVETDDLHTALFFTSSSIRPKKERSFLRRLLSPLMVWNPVEYSTEENTRWSLLRALEWIEWPLFLSQPVVPVLLYFYPWPWVLGAAVLISLMWRLLVVPSFISPELAGLGPWFVNLKYVTAPVMAVLLWRENEPWIAALALLWPFAGLFVVQFVVSLIYAPFTLSARGKASQVGIVQERFMTALGYEKNS